MEGHRLHPFATGQAGALTSHAPPPVAWASGPCPGQVSWADRGARLFGAVAALAGLLTALGIVAAPDRAWPAILVGAVYAVGVSLGALSFLAFHYLSKAGWSVVVKRIAEGFALSMPFAALGVALVLAGLPHLYEWSHESALRADPLLREKSVWLNPAAFAARAAACVALWSLFAWALRRESLRQDADGSGAHTHRNTALSALFAVTLALTATVASFDWLMSLEPHWFSTVFAASWFTGSFVSGLCAITLAAIALRRGPLRGVVTDDHLHDLAKLLLGFSTFWAYLWFCQYMLIWYANLPEEIPFFLRRHDAPWAALAIANVAASWAIPFLVLLPRAAKRNARVLWKVCVVLLIGHWLDLAQIVLPVFQGASPTLGWWEFAPTVAALALLLWAAVRAWAAAPLLPAKDPLLAEGLHHQQ